MNYDDLHVDSLDDLEETGLAYLQLRRAVERAEKRLKAMFDDPDNAGVVRGDVLNVMLILREALED